MYVHSTIQSFLQLHTDPALIYLTGVFLGGALGFIKTSHQVQQEYKKNMGIAKQLFMEHQGNLEELAQLEQYRQLNPSTHYEAMWMKEYLQPQSPQDPDQ